jgi:hypothetical protein
VRTLTGKGVRVEFVKDQLTFSGEDSPMATLMLSVMGAFAEFERALILERQREGIAAAKARGVYTGRKPALTGEQADELRRRAAAGEHKSAPARDYRISRETVYAYLRPDAPPSPADGAQDTPAGATAQAPVLTAQTSSPPSAIGPRRPARKTAGGRWTCPPSSAPRPGPGSWSRPSRAAGTCATTAPGSASSAERRPTAAVAAGSHAWTPASLCPPAATWPPPAAPCGAPATSRPPPSHATQPQRHAAADSTSLLQTPVTRPVKINLSDNRCSAGQAWKAAWTCRPLDQVAGDNASAYVAETLRDRMAAREEPWGQAGAGAAG